MIGANVRYCVLGLLLAVAGCGDSAGSKDTSADAGGTPSPQPQPQPQPQPTAAPTPLPTPVTGLSVTVTYQGQSYVFDQSAGMDRGTYVDPQGQFQQQSIRVTNPGLPNFAVSFRPDTTGGRIELVFELGQLFGSPTPFNMAAYEADISQNGNSLAKIPVPNHYWYSRWRWQSAPRPARAMVPDLMAKGLLPHFDPTVSPGTPTAAAVPYKIMGLGGVYPSMTATGDRSDIGPVTEWQADYIMAVLTGNANASTLLSTILDQGDASGTIPSWHFRDENTGAPLDTFKFPEASLYAGQSGVSPLIVRSSGTGMTVSATHEPDLAYLPFLLTGDPYYLEELEFSVVNNVLELTPAARATYGKVEALRGWAWSLRNMAQAATVVPAATPSWLLPQSYFTELMAGNLAYSMTLVNDTTDVDRALFHTLDETFGSTATGGLPYGTQISPWQEDYSLIVLAWVVGMGHADWRPVLEWKVEDEVARTSGASGWIRAVSSPYRMGLRQTSTSPWFSTWADAWTWTSTNTGLTYVDPDTLVVTGAGSLTYPSITLGALGAAANQGVAAAAPNYQWLLTQLQKNLTPSNGHAGYYTSQKFAISP